MGSSVLGLRCYVQDHPSGDFDKSYDILNTPYFRNELAIKKYESD